VKGPIRFDSGVVLRGNVSFENPDSTTKTVHAGLYENESVRL